jgi:hypothetical protein
MRRARALVSSLLEARENRGALLALCFNRVHGLRHSIGMKSVQSANLVRSALLIALASSGCEDNSQGSSLDNLLAVPVGLSVCADAGLTAPPIVLTPKSHNIWPPNHKFHSFSVADCISATSCEPLTQAVFTWGSSDEPVDDLGDGHFAPDIMFDGCDTVQLRSERQGPKDGRVYKLGVRVVNTLGQVADSVCTVIVDHDQRGVLGADSGESYRVLASQSTGVSCDTPPVTVPPPPLVHDAGYPSGPIGI